MIRKFSLVNEYNERFVLNDVKRGYFTEPSGLGMDKEYAYTRIGNAWSKSYSRFAQAQITGTLLFAGDPYTAMTNVIEYLRMADDLRLFYETDAGEYFKKVDLVSFGKTEIEEGHVLKCPITLICKTLWRKENAYRIVVGASGSATGKAYTVDNNAYQYDYTYNEFTNGEVEINNTGSVPAGFTVAFLGAITNPKIELKINGTTTATADIEASCLLGESIRYSSKDEELYCIKRGQNGDTNLVGGMGIVNENFFKVPVGRSVLKVSADSEITSNVEITVNTEFGVV